MYVRFEVLVTVEEDERPCIYRVYWREKSAPATLNEVDGRGTAIFLLLFNWDLNSERRIYQSIAQLPTNSNIS